MELLPMLATGGGLMAVGAAIVVFAFRITKVGEQVDAVGSTTDPEDVEPADWNVGLTVGVGILLVLAGVMVLLLGAGEVLWNAF